MRVLKQIDDNISQLNKNLNWTYYARTFVLEHLETFDSLPDAQLCGDKIDFNHLKHDQVMEVIKAFPGRWKKEPNGETIHYSITLRNESKTAGLYEIIIRCYAGQPPPNCKIVYEDVHVPAQTVRRAKMVCADRPELNGSNENKEAIQDAEVVEECPF